MKLKEKSMKLKEKSMKLNWTCCDFVDGSPKFLVTDVLFTLHVVVEAGRSVAHNQKCPAHFAHLHLFLQHQLCRLFNDIYYESCENMKTETLTKERPSPFFNDSRSDLN